MNKNLFDVVYSEFDYEEHFFLESPVDTTLEEFRKLCNHLLPKAGYQAALKHMNLEKGWIGWRDVVGSLVSLLEEQGYQRVSLETVQVPGGFVIGLDDFEESSTYGRLGFAGPLIADYNRKLEKKLAEERKLKKFSSLRKKAVQIIK